MMVVAHQVSSLARRPPLAKLSAERCPPRLRELVEECWEADPMRRPAVSCVCPRACLLRRLGRPRGGARRPGAHTHARTRTRVHKHTAAAFSAGLPTLTAGPCNAC